MDANTVIQAISFLSTLSLRRATTHPIDVLVRVVISIHALLAESDLYTIPETLVPRQFLSTLSLRRATTHDAKGPGCVFDFYPRSPCGERPCGNAGIGTPISISIHALLAESDRSGEPWQAEYRDFYPRSPCGERPAGPDCQGAGPSISIHALLAESDEDQNWASSSGPLFLSTLSLRRATAVRIDQIRTIEQISIHALLAESDIGYSVNLHPKTGFLSTLSLRRATCLLVY